MKKTSLFFCFLIAVACHLYNSTLLPSLHLEAFAPFIALCLVRFPLLRLLWTALLCGLIVDLTSSAYRFGVTAFIYLLASFILQRYKHYFSSEKWLSLSFLTFWFSLLTFIARTFFEPALLNLEGIAIDGLLMPFFDAVYAFICFTCPMVFYQQLQAKSRIR